VIVASTASVPAQELRKVSFTFSDDPCCDPSEKGCIRVRLFERPNRTKPVLQYPATPILQVDPGYRQGSSKVAVRLVRWPQEKRIFGYADRARPDTRTDYWIVTLHLGDTQVEHFSSFSPSIVEDPRAFYRLIWYTRFGFSGRNGRPPRDEDKLAESAPFQLVTRDRCR
jgi:hypothetical protein